MDNPAASIVITTKNRLDELVLAVQSSLSQSVPVEVLVMDDGSSDGTAQAIQKQFPSVRLERSDTSQGYIVQRNRAARLASAEFIFSMDDDAVFTSSNVVGQTLALFDDPRVGAVAIPYAEPYKSPIVRQRAPAQDGIFVTDWFIGTAHALRKGVFSRLGGYRERLVHQGEETDYAIRMLGAGYVVRLGYGDVIHHRESPNRDFDRASYFGRRNDILFAWHNVPMPHFPFHMAGATVNAVAAAFRIRPVAKMLQGVGRGITDCWRYRHMRQPVSRETYRLHRLLRAGGPRLLSDIESMLPRAGFR